MTAKEVDADESTNFSRSRHYNSTYRFWTALQIAEMEGILGFGQTSDMIKFAPKSQLTAIIDD